MQPFSGRRALYSFYAGALLKSHEGYPVGTLCVLGHEALDLTPTQQFSLRVLADQIMAQLEYRRQISDLTYDLRVERRLSSKRKAHVESVGAITENLQEERQLAAAAHDAGNRYLRSERRDRDDDRFGRVLPAVRCSR